MQTLGRQVYAERHWELASRYYLDTRFELDVKVDVDNAGAEIVLVDGGETFAGAIQEAAWPGKLSVLHQFGGLFRLLGMS